MTGVPASDSAQGRNSYQESKDLGSGPALPIAGTPEAGYPLQSPSREPLGAKLLKKRHRDWKSLP